jgi:hypothetical protein
MTAHRPIALQATARYLVISRIGVNSLHRQWLPNDANFDVLLSCYDPTVEQERRDGVMFEYRPGAKVAGYGQVIRDYESLIRQYRYVALFDDDLATDAASLLRLFRVADEQALKIAQPALDHQSYFTHACLLRHKGFVLRHVNFIEMMCPLFRSDVLLDLAPLFELGFESGIDLVWSALAHGSPEDFAVIDSVPVRHTRPVGAAKSVNGFVGGRVYESDIRAALAHFGLPWVPVLTFGGLRPSGSYSRNRLVLVLEALRLVTALPIRSARFRLVAMMRYWRQLIRYQPESSPASRRNNQPLGGRWATGGDRGSVRTGCADSRRPRRS